MLPNKKALIEINETCSLVRDCIYQELGSSARWFALSERLEKYLGEEGLPRIIENLIRSSHRNVSEDDLKSALIQLSRHRAWILDAVQQEMNDSVRWPILRSQLLKYFGDRGLQGQIVSIFESGANERGLS